MATRKRTASAEAGAPVTAAFEVVSNLSLDNEDYVPGDTVYLTEDQAIEVGSQVVKPATAPAAE